MQKLECGLGGIGELAGDLAPVAGLAPWLPVRTFTHATLPLHGVGLDPSDRLFVDPALTPGDSWRRFLSLGVDDVPAALANQLLGWARSGRFTSRDGRTDYLEGLGGVRHSVLVMASSGDRIAPPASVRPAYDALAVADRRWRLVAREAGASADYGHMDLLFSESARADVWLPVAEFLGEAR